MSHTILLVDDEPKMRDVLGATLADLGYRPLVASSGPEALEILEREEIDLILSDLRMPKMSGRELLLEVKRRHPNLPVVFITAYSSVKDAVQAIKEGAFDYIGKPFEIEELDATLVNALRLHDALRDNQRLRQELEGRYSFDNLIGTSASFRQVIAAIGEVCESRANVLIQGESGTGKEMVARAIHFNSPRKDKPFVALNCAAIPEGLLESELFGHVKGAFTGAAETRAGFFQTGNKGTIFLDEVGETSLAMQVKLLRVLQEKEICMVGSARSQKVDARIIAGTNKNLQSLIAGGRFREDLFYRLNVITLELPPLRSRGADVLLLTRYFSAKYAAEMGRAAPQYTDRALESLNQYSWPGNVRELENLVQRIMAMTEGDIIDAPDLPPGMRSECFAEERGLDRSLEQVEAEYIRHVLERVEGNKSQAAKILGIDRKTLREKLKRYRVSD